MSNTTSEMRQSGMTFQRMPQGTIIVVSIIVLALVAAAAAVTVNRRQAVESSRAASAAISTVSEAERFTPEWYAWYLAGQPVAVVIPPTGTSFLYQSQQLNEMAAELGGASGFAIPSEAERFTPEWYEWHQSQSRIAEPGTTLDFDYAAPYLNKAPATSTSSFSTDEYWQLAAEHAKAEADDWAYYTERYRQRRH